MAKLNIEATLAAILPLLTQDEKDEIVELLRDRLIEKLEGDDE